MENQGIYQAHAYAITGSEIINVNSVLTHRLIRIRNPHGIKASEALIGAIKYDPSIKHSLLGLKVDEESWILLEDYVKFFATLDICNLTPNNINPDVFTDDHTAKLALTTVEGRWMGGIFDDYVRNNAEILDTNPQYRMTLKRHHEDNKTYSILIGLSLKHREDLKLVTDSIFNDDKNLPKPLNSGCKKCMDEIMRSKRGRFNGGQVGYRLELPPGVYYILPLIMNTIKRATYFLQILSEEKDILEVYDRDVNVPKMKDQFQKISETVSSCKKNRKVYKEFQNRYTKTADFKALYLILKNPKVSTNRLCKRPIQLDGLSLNLQKLFSSEKFGSRKRLSIEAIEHIFSTSANIFIKYDVSKSGFVPYTRMKRMLDEFGYELPYTIIEILVDTYRDESRIYYDKFIQCFVHMSLIFGKIEKKLSENNGQEFNVCFDDLLHKFWLKMESRKLYTTLSLEEAIASLSDDIQKQTFQAKSTYYRSNIFMY
ncbi:calpain-2 catalytic subunit-like [Aphidius gifuensis]|uniref:calpain-2 catalytic subunit-like n=1 Tax=Aphidius gifuensis TaxID=684658 RepID=UPI001CDBDBC1|nr:calpain-2 catalytic subunit-like [Aphidius gifuensis]